MGGRLHPAGRTQRGSGWVEFAIVAALLSGLVVILLPHIHEYQERAEKALVDLTVRSLRTTLRWQIAQRMFHGGMDDLAGLVGANPVPWLERPPAGYLGELADEAQDLAGGTWYFHTATRELVYVPKRESSLAVPGGGPARLRWQVRQLKPSLGGDVKAPVDALVVTEVTPYQWF
ncbi:MAG: hypothetical protein WBP72_12560 [Rhodocyclaceae bacterium]